MRRQRSGRDQVRIGIAAIVIGVIVAAGALAILSGDIAVVAAAGGFAFVGVGAMTWWSGRDTLRAERRLT